MPTDRHNAHVIVAWIKFDQLELILDKTQSETEQISQHEALEYQVDAVVYEDGSYESIAGSKGFEHTDHLCAFHHEYQDDGDHVHANYGEDDPEQDVHLAAQQFQPFEDLDEPVAHTFNVEIEVHHFTDRDTGVVYVFGIIDEYLQSPGDSIRPVIQSLDQSDVRQHDSAVEVFGEICLIDAGNFQPPKARRVLEKVNNDLVPDILFQFSCDGFAQYYLTRITRVLVLDKLTAHNVLLEGREVETPAHPLDEYAERFVIRFYNANLVRKLLHMPHERIFARFIVKFDLKIHRLFLRGVVHRKFCNENVTAETIDLFLDCFLEPFHDEERNNGSRQTDGDADDSDAVNRR